jgi:glutamyl-tRNA synthetase
MPLILNKGGGKLSKRQGDVFVEDYLAKGYLLEALINFCVLLGWHPKGDREIYSLEELKKIFNIDGIGANPAVFDTDKLNFFNGHYIRQKGLAELTNLLIPYLAQDGIISTEEGIVTNLLSGQKITREKLENIISLTQERLVILSDIGNLIKPYLSEINYEPSLLLWKSLTMPEIKAKLEEMKNVMTKISETDWKKEIIEEKILSYIKDKEGKNGDYLWPLRVSLTGEKNSPGPFESAWALGKEDSLTRIDTGISLCVQN